VTAYPGAVQRIRLVDVAREAGVHPATASRALNPATRGEVNRNTVRRVAQAAQRLGYVPNVLARGLRTSRSSVVALVIPDIGNTLFAGMVRGAARVLTEAGFTPVLIDTNNDPSAERAQVASMRARGMDGFIVATARWEDPLLDELADSDLPIVLVNRQTQTRRLPYIGTDDQHGVQMCVDHLAALGHRRIMHLAGPGDTSTGRERAAAFQQAMRAHGLPAGASSVTVCAAFTEEAGFESTRTLLSGGQRFTAILAGNDLLALGAMTALRQAGLRCPEDVSVIGFNDLPFMDKLTPALTTVRRPMGDMGALAARALLDWIANPATRHTTQTLLPVELIVRGTTQTAAR
jgi:LacI family transcriptional regulator